jgi:excisionase family DNA binding protein
VNEPLIDLQEAAKRLGTSERHLRRMVFERRIPFVKVGAKLRFDPAEVADFIDANHYPAQHGRRRGRGASPFGGA